MHHNLAWLAEIRTAASGADATRLRALWLDARAVPPIVLANPAIDFDQIVLMTQYAEHTNPNITGSQVAWKHKPGGDIWSFPAVPRRRACGR